MQVVAFALEKRMLFDVQYDVEVAGRPSMSACFAEAGKTDSSSVFNTGWDLRIDGSLTQHTALAFALAARISDYAACALTGGAGASHTEKPLLIAYLAAASAGTAGDGGLAWGCAGATAFLAGLVAAHRDSCFRAEDGLLEFQRDILTQIGAALGTTAAAGTAPEEVAKTEKISEDFAYILEGRGIKAARSCATHGGMSEAIVRGPLVDVGKDCVSFAALFEFFFGVGVIRVPVRVKLQRQLAIGALDLLLTRLAGDPKHFVVIAFYIAGQNGFKSFRVLVLRVARNLNHRGTKQAVLQLIAALQFFENLMIRNIGGFDHFDGLVKMRVEGFTLCRNRAQTHFQQCILQLLMDEFNPAAELGFLRRPGLQRALKAVEDRKQRLDRIRYCEFTEVLLLASGAFACILEFSLQAGETINQRVPFRLKFL